MRKELDLHMNCHTQGVAKRSGCSEIGELGYMPKDMSKDVIILQMWGFKNGDG